DIGRAGAERLAAVTAGGVLCVVDVQPDDLPVGQRTHEAVKATLAVAAPTAQRTGVGLGLAADGNDFLSRFWPHAHGLRSQVTEVRDRCSRTQALSVNPPSTYGDSRHFRGVALTPTIVNASTILNDRPPGRAAGVPAAAPSPMSTYRCAWRLPGGRRST